MSAIISHRLDLAVLLIDTTTGYHVSSESASITFDRPNMPLTVNRGSGMHILMNAGRENMVMTVKVAGYETHVVPINYDELDKNLPMKEVFLIPSENSTNAGNYISIRGKLPGLSDLSLILRHECVAHTDAYDKKKRILSVFEKGNRLNQEGSPYAIFYQREGFFVPFDVIENVDSNKVKLKEDLAEELSRNAPICRILFGYVEPDGSYLIRVRDDRSTLTGLIRYSVDGQIRFKEVDFHEEGNSLEL